MIMAAKKAKAKDAPAAMHHPHDPAHDLAIQIVREMRGYDARTIWRAVDIIRRSWKRWWRLRDFA
jgi:hypothetical protein